MGTVLLVLVLAYLSCGLVFGAFYLAGTLSDPEERKRWESHILAFPLVVLILPAVAGADLARHLVRELFSRRNR